MCALEYARVCPGQVTSDLTRKRRRPSRAAHRQCGESRAETPALALRGVEKLRKCRCALRHALRSAAVPESNGHDMDIDTRCISLNVYSWNLP